MTCSRMSWKLAELRWRDEAGLYESRWERRSGPAEWRCKITVGEREKSRSRSRSRPPPHDVLERWPPINAEVLDANLVVESPSKNAPQQAVDALPAPSTTIRDQLLTLSTCASPSSANNILSSSRLRIDFPQQSPSCIAADLKETDLLDIDCSPQTPFNFLRTCLERSPESFRLESKLDNIIRKSLHSLYDPEG